MPTGVRLPARGQSWCPEGRGCGPPPSQALRGAGGSRWLPCDQPGSVPAGFSVPAAETGTGQATTSLPFCGQR